jgi:hypothetical protein
MHKAMENSIHKKEAASRKGMGDYTRLILAYYSCLVLLSIYQHYSLNASGILPSFGGSTLVILLAHHLGFTAFLSLFLYFTFNALESIRPRMGHYVTAGILAGMLVLESALTWYFLAQYQMPQPVLKAVPALFTTTARVLPVTAVLMGSILIFFALYKLSAPMQHWMGRVYPFTLALFSLFLATLLGRSEPISENKTKYMLSEVYNEAFYLQDPLEIAVSGAGLDPLQEVYQKEEELIWKTSRADRVAVSLFPGDIQARGPNGFFPDPFSKTGPNQYTYRKPAGKDLLRIQNTFYGRDFDRAFETARKLAHTGNYQGALELCNYILSEDPGYADAEILLGRILAWRGDYSGAAGVLEQAVRKHPFYEDAYAALLDTYFWDGHAQESMALEPAIETYFKESADLKERMERARKMNQSAHRAMESGKTGDLPHL